VSKKVIAYPDPTELQVVVYPAKVLRVPAQPVTDFGPGLEAVVGRMKQLMEQHEGVGLAAPQVGLSLRLFVWSPTGEANNAIAVINPELTAHAGTQLASEGCLSLPEIRARITRAMTVHVQAKNEHNQSYDMDLTEFSARIVQHENDHLEGVLILDRMGPAAKIANRGKIRALEEAAG